MPRLNFCWRRPVVEVEPSGASSQLESHSGPTVRSSTAGEHPVHPVQGFFHDNRIHCLNMGPRPDNEAWSAPEATQFQVVRHRVRQEDVVPPADEVELGCTGHEPGTKI